jgi:hypothetical protein
MWILVDSKYSQQIFSRIVKNNSFKVSAVIIYGFIEHLGVHFLRGIVQKLRNLKKFGMIGLFEIWSSYVTYGYSLIGSDQPCPASYQM